LAESPQLWLFDDAPILGGAEIFALRLARFLATADRGSLRIVCPPESELARRCAAEGIAHVPASFPPLGPQGAARWPGAIRAVRALLRRAGPGAIAIGNTARAQAYLTAASVMLRRRPPIVQIVHERDTLARVSGRIAYRRVGSLVAIGGRISALCRERLPDVPVWEANLFLNRSEYEGAAREPRRRAEPVLGVLARFIPGKGQLDLMEELSGAGIWSRALFAGRAEDREYADRVAGRIAALGLGERISLLGPVDDLDGFFDSIDVLIVPSTGSFEGQGMVIVEALFHGRPALVRRRVFSSGDYDGLPVLPYEGPAELEARLEELPRDPVPLEELRRRFGPEQALEAILAAAAQRPQG
jgi:glycosyltransferase involved in cell wall biosynthesis